MTPQLTYAAGTVPASLICCVIYKISFRCEQTGLRRSPIKRNSSNVKAQIMNQSAQGRANDEQQPVEAAFPPRQLLRDQHVITQKAVKEAVTMTAR